MKHPFAMVDIETFGVQADTIIFAVAVCCMRPESGKCIQGVYDVAKRNTKVWLPNMQEQKDAGRTTDQGTIDFWNKRKDTMRQILSSGQKVGAKDLIVNVNAFLEEKGYDKRNSLIWMRAPHFDQKLLEHYFRQINDADPPWNHWKIRDIRTAVDMVTGDHFGYYPKSIKDDIENQIGNTSHDPADDVARDVVNLHLAYGAIGHLEMIELDEIPF